MVFPELLTRTSEFTMRTVLAPQGDKTVDTRSKLSRYEYSAPPTGPVRVDLAVAWVIWDWTVVSQRVERRLVSRGSHREGLGALQ